MARENKGWIKDEWIKHEILEITSFMLIGIIMAVVLPIFVGFGLKAFEDSFIVGRPLEFGDLIVKFMIYYIMILAGLIGLSILKVREMFATEAGQNIARQKNPSLFSVAYLHDPEIDGALYNLFRSIGMKGKKNPMKWSLSAFRVFVIATIFFGAFSLLQTIVPEAQVAGIPQTAFQMTETAEVIFTAEPASFGETTMMLFILSLISGINAWFVSKFKLPPGVFWAIQFMIVCPLIGVGWMGYHMIVYGNSEVALFATFLFGWLGATITVLFGTWIMWYVWHFWNNIFAKLRVVVSANEDIVFISTIILVLLIVAWISVELLIKKYKKKRKLPPLPAE